MPDAVEASHMGHPDFRVGAKIFATLGHPDRAWGMVKLSPEQQAMYLEMAPKSFTPAAGAWGRRGSTHVRLSATEKNTLRDAIVTAWRNVAPKSVARRAETTVAADGADRPDRDLDRAFARVRAALKAARLPEVEEGVSYGTPAMKVRGKFLMRVKDADTLVFRCSMEDKHFLMEAAPAIYFETDHYKGWPAVLVRLSEADEAELARCLDRAWRLQAPRKLVTGLDAKATPTETKQASRRTRPVRGR
jgi:hypothetical protein